MYSGEDCVGEIVLDPNVLDFVLAAVFLTCLLTMFSVKHQQGLSLPATCHLSHVLISIVILSILYFHSTVVFPTHTRMFCMVATMFVCGCQLFVCGSVSVVCVWVCVGCLCVGLCRLCLSEVLWHQLLLLWSLFAAAAAAAASACTSIEHCSTSPGLTVSRVDGLPVSQVDAGWVVVVP